MATAGSIVVDLLMRTGAFETDSKRAEKRLKELKREAVDAGKVIGTAIVAGATAAVTALKLTIDSMDEMSKAAQKVGASTEEFSKLTYAASLADVSMETLASSLGKLTKSQAAALNVTSQQAKVFEALGISVKNADGSLRDSTDVLEDFADVFKRLGGSPEAMAAGFAIFGRSFQDLIPLLKDGSAGIREAGDELEAFGGVLSTEAGNNAEEFNDNLTRLQTAAKSLAQAVASDLLPDLVRLTENWVELSKDGSTLQETATGIANVFRVVGGVVEFVGGYFTALDNIIQGATMGFLGFAEAAKGVIGLNWDQIKRGLNLASDGADLAYYGTAPASETAGSKPRARAGSSRRGGGPMNLAPAFDNSAALRAALGGGVAAPKKSRGGGGGGKSEAEQEAERLQQRYESLKESLEEQEYLFGKVGEAAKVRYDTELGELEKLDPLKKAELIQLAEEQDAREQLADMQQAADEASKEESDRIQRALKDTDDLIDDMQFELSLIGKTNAEREKAITLRGLEAEATDEQKAAIAGLVDELHRASELQGVVDDFKEGLSDAFVDFVSGAKSAKEAFGDFADDLFKRALQFVTDKAIDAMFSAFDGTGSKKGDSTSGWLNTIFSFFGGAKASGGDVISGRSYLVGEQGPEMFVPRTAGLIMPSRETAAMGGGGGNFSQKNEFYLAAPTSQRTQEQIAQRTGQKVEEIQRRNS